MKIIIDLANNFEGLMASLVIVIGSLIAMSQEAFFEALKKVLLGFGIFGVVFYVFQLAGVWIYGE